MVVKTNKRNLSRERRRLLISIGYAGLAAYAGAALLTDSGLLILFATAGYGAIVIIHLHFLYPFTQKIADQSDSTLDERQRIVRNRAGYLSYRILGWAVMLLSTYLMLRATWFESGFWPLRIAQEDALPLYISAVWLIITLPTAIIAWTEQDSEPEDSY